MSALVAVILAMATTLCGLAIAMTRGDLWKAAPHWLAYALFAVSGAFYILAATLAMLNVRRESRSSLRKEKEVSTKDAAPEENVEDVQLEDLLAIFDGKTEIQAQLYVQRWLGKRVRLNARVWDVSPLLDRSEFMVSLMTANGLSQCHFFIPKTQLNDYTHFQRGTKITVVGTIAKLAACDLQLKAVQLVNVEDQPVS